VWIALAAVLLATTLAYWPGIRAPFDFDDIGSIQKNATIRMLNPAQALHPPGGDLAVSGRPVANYSLAIDYAANRWFGVDQRPDPFGPNKTFLFHATNLFLHLACGLALFLLVRDTLRRGHFSAEWRGASSRVALVAASVWLLHPLQTEAVNYVVQRTELLVSLFYALTLYALVRAHANAGSRSWTWRIVAVAACALGMASKEVMLTAPFVVLLYDRAFRVDRWRDLFRRRDDILTYLGLAATMAIGIIEIMSGSRKATVGFGLGLPWYEYLQTQGWAIPHYVRQFIWPSDLTIDYGQRAVLTAESLLGVVVLAAAGVAVLVAWLRSARWPWLGFVGAWFFVLLAPSSSVVPIASEIAAERRVYLALAALTVLAAVGLERVRQLLIKKCSSSGMAALNAGAAAILLVLAAATARRAASFSRPEELWAEAIARVPSNPRAYDGLAYILVRQSPADVERAASAARSAIALDSTDQSALGTLAAIDIKQARFAEAKALLDRDLAANPRDSVAATEQGIVLVALGRPNEAARYLAKPDIEDLIDMDPTGGWLFELGTSDMAMERPAAAAPVFQRVLELNPAKAEATAYLADALLRLSRPEDAARAVERAEQNGSASALALALLATARATQGNSAAAVAAARSAAGAPGADAMVFALCAKAMTVVGQTSLSNSFARAANGVR
jgi:protein O-mannosyl-transferase